MIKTIKTKILIILMILALIVPSSAFGLSDTPRGSFEEIGTISTSFTKLDALPRDRIVIFGSHKDADLMDEPFLCKVLVDEMDQEVILTYLEYFIWNNFNVVVTGGSGGMIKDEMIEEAIKRTEQNKQLFTFEEYPSYLVRIAGKDRYETVAMVNAFMEGKTPAVDIFKLSTLPSLGNIVYSIQGIEFRVAQYDVGKYYHTGMYTLYNDYLKL